VSVNGENARDAALRRDREARERLSNDPIAQIKMQRREGTLYDQHLHPRRHVLSDPSPPERAALAGLASGLTYQEVAEIQGIDVETVKTQLKSVRVKLGARNSVQAGAMAVREGIIP